MVVTRFLWLFLRVQRLRIQCRLGLVVPAAPALGLCAGLGHGSGLRRWRGSRLVGLLRKRGRLFVLGGGLGGRRHWFWLGAGSQLLARGSLLRGLLGIRGKLLLLLYASRLRGSCNHLQNWQGEGSRLAGSRLRGGNNVAALQDHGNGLRLDGGGFGESEGGDALKNVLVQPELGKL